MRTAARGRLAAGRGRRRTPSIRLAEGEWGPTRTGRAPSLGGDGRVRAAVRHPAVAGVPDGQRPPVQPDGRHRPEQGWDQQRSVGRSGDRRAGLDQRRPGRRDGGPGPARRRSSSRWGASGGSACSSRCSTCSTTPTSAEVTSATAGACCSVSPPGASSRGSGTHASCNWAPDSCFESFVYSFGDARLTGIMVVVMTTEDI